jgi:hypothetical protein
MEIRFDQAGLITPVTLVPVTAVTCMRILALQLGSHLSLQMIRMVLCGHDTLDFRYRNRRQIPTK